MFQRGLTTRPMALIKKLWKAKREAPAGEKPEPVRTHLRNMNIVPEMIGSIIGVYNVVGLVSHYICGHAGLAAIVVGNGLALSSTAVVLQPACVNTNLLSTTMVWLHS